VVDESQLPLAYSRQESITTAIQLAAPALVGQALRVIAAPFALVLAAVCRLVSAFFSYRVKVEGKDAPTEHDPFWESLREGVRFSLRNKPVMIIMFSLVFVNFGLALGSAVETIYYVRVLDLGPASIGAVLTSAGLGGLIGSLAAPRLVAKVSQAWCLAGALCLLVPVVASLPLLSYLEQGTLPLLAIQTFLYSFLIVIFNINSYTLVTTLTPKRLVGRQLSFVGFASMGVVPVGSLMGGFSGDVFGLEQTLWIWVAVSILAALPVVIGRKRIESSETPA
jgi:Na+/melibiose symporter-like transporter